MKIKTLNNFFKILGIIFIFLAFTVFANASPNNSSDGCDITIGYYGRVMGIQSTGCDYTALLQRRHPSQGSWHTIATFTGSDQKFSNTLTIGYFYSVLVRPSDRSEDEAKRGPFGKLTDGCLETYGIYLSPNNAWWNGCTRRGSLSGTYLLKWDAKPQPPFDPCDFSYPPKISKPNDVSIRYNSYFEIDFWNHASDPIFRLSELEFDYKLSKEELLSCNLRNNRYLECESSTIIGSGTIELKATNPCDKSVTTILNVEVFNNPPTINPPNLELSCASNFEKIINLRNYSSDEERNLLKYSVVSQSDKNLLNCFITDDYFLSCEIVNCYAGNTDIKIRATDVLGAYRENTSRITIKDFPPFLKTGFPSICINRSEEKLIDLRDHFYDKEDGYNLDYELSQKDTTNISCRIVDDYFISCDLKTNKNVSSELEIKATDSAQNSITKKMVIWSNCFEGVEVVSEQKFFCLENCTSHTTEILVTNKSDYKCFDFVLDHKNYLNASLSSSSFCLNKNETRSFYLNVDTCNADRSFYDLRIRDYDNDIELNLEYQIGACTSFGSFEVREFDGVICNNEKRDFTVFLKNNSSEGRFFELRAENQLLLPYFSREKVFLEPFETKELMLTVNARSILGKQTVQLSAFTDNYHIEKKLLVDVKDCSQIKERNFLIEAPSTCFNVQKGQYFEGSFNVRRVNFDCPLCSLEEKSLRLFMGLQGELSEDVVTIEGAGSKKVYYRIKIPENEPAGPLFVTIRGEEIPTAPFAETGFVENAQVCLNVQGTSNAFVNVKTGVIDIPYCESELFELEIVNSGDFEETFSLSVLEKPFGVNVHLMQEEVTVPKKSSKNIFVLVASTPDSMIADNQIAKIKLEGNISMQAILEFNIKEKTVFDVLEILSHSSIIETRANSEKSYYIQLRNNSENNIRNLRISFENLPEGVIAEEKIIENIAPEQVIKISGKILVGNVEGEYTPLFVLEKVHNDTPYQLMNKEEFELIILKEEGFFAGILGFFLLADGSINLSSIFMATVLFLTLLLLIVILGVAFSDSSPRKERWLMNNEDYLVE